MLIELILDTKESIGSGASIGVVFEGMQDNMWFDSRGCQIWLAFHSFASSAFQRFVAVCMRLS